MGRGIAGDVPGFKLDKQQIISLVKSYYSFPEPIKIKEPKTVITGLQLHDGDLRVYFEDGITLWDYCEDDFKEQIIKYLKTLQ